MKLVWPLLTRLLRVRRRPEQVCYPYLRCDQCGEIAPRTEERTVSTLEVPWPAWVRLPPESVCPLCGYAQPRAVDDELPLDIELTCTAVDSWHGVWLTCGERYGAHRGAAFGVCSRCGTRSDELLAPQGHRRRRP